MGATLKIQLILTSYFQNELPARIYEHSVTTYQRLLQMIESLELKH